MSDRYSGIPESGYRPVAHDASYSLLRATGRAAQGRRACEAQILLLPNDPGEPIWFRYGADDDSLLVTKSESAAQTLARSILPPRRGIPLGHILEHLGERVGPHF